MRKLAEVSEVEKGFLIALVIGLLGNSLKVAIESSGRKFEDMLEFIGLFISYFPENFVMGCFASAFILLSVNHSRTEGEEKKEEDDN